MRRLSDEPLNFFLALAVLLALFLPCILLQTGSAKGDEDSCLSAENNTLYLKGNAEGDDLWMNANSSMGDSSSFHTVSETCTGTGCSINEEYVQNFPGERNISLRKGDNIHIEIHLERSGMADDADLHIILEAGNHTLVDATVGESGDDIFVVDTPAQIGTVNASDLFILTWSYLYRGETEYTMYTHGTSFVELPVVNDLDGDGLSDDEDDDDDGDGYTDEEEEAAGTDPRDPGSYPQSSSSGNSDDGSPLADGSMIPGREEMVFMVLVALGTAALLARISMGRN